MPWSLQQRRIVRDSMLACLVCAVVLGAGYIWLPPALFGLDGQLGIGDRVAFALKADLPVFLWLADCVRAVSKGLNRPGFRGGCLVKVKRPRRRFCRVGCSSLPQPRRAGYSRWMSAGAYG